MEHTVTDIDTLKQILFIINRDLKGIQLLDPEDLQGCLAYLVYQVMEKLDPLAHQAHQDPLQYMDQVRGSDFAFHYVCEHICTLTYPPHTLFFCVLPSTCLLSILESGCSPLS